MARKKVMGADVNGMPTSHPPTSDPQRRAARLAPPTRNGVRTSFSARVSQPPKLRARQPAGLDAGFAKRHAHRDRDSRRTRGVAVNADGVELARLREANGLGGRGVSVKHRSRLRPRRKAAIAQEEPVGESLSIAR